MTKAITSVSPSHCQQQQLLQPKPQPQRSGKVDRLESWADFVVVAAPVCLKCLGSSGCSIAHCSMGTVTRLTSAAPGSCVLEPLRQGPGCCECCCSGALSALCSFSPGAAGLPPLDYGRSFTHRCCLIDRLNVSRGRGKLTLPLLLWRGLALCRKRSAGATREHPHGDGSHRQGSVTYLITLGGQLVRLVLFCAQAT